MPLPIYRLLLNPAAEQGGGGSTPTATATPTPTATAKVVSIPADEYERLRGVEGQFSQLAAAKQAEVEGKERERLLALAGKGQAEQALQQLDDGWKKKAGDYEKNLTDLRSRYHGEKLQTAIADATAGVRWASEKAALQARKLIAEGLDVVADAQGVVSVIDKATRRPAGDAIKELLAGDDLAHFLEPSQRGKGGLGQGNQATPTWSQDAVAPDIVGAIKSKIDWQQKQAAARGIVRTPGL